MQGLFVVLGATGVQVMLQCIQEREDEQSSLTQLLIKGSSIIDEALKRQMKIRALTRNTSSAAADALRAKGVEVCRADMEDADSLVAGFKVNHLPAYIEHCHLLTIIREPAPSSQ